MPYKVIWEFCCKVGDAGKSVLAVSIDEGKMLECAMDRCDLMADDGWSSQQSNDFVESAFSFLRWNGDSACSHVPTESYVVETCAEVLSFLRDVVPRDS